jgi:membrane protein DedA with SNARE-associated domain
MMIPVPGSVVIPMLGVPSTLASIDARAVAAAAVCVVVSLLAAWTVIMLQRRPGRAARSRSWGTLAERLHLARHAA